MQINSKSFEFLVGDFEVMSHMPSVPALPVFSDRMVDFLSELSQELRKDKRTKNNIDVASYAYWIRRASLNSAREEHKDRENRIGRGVAFHVAPSNVPVNFAVSMTSSALAGNITLIRVSNKKFEQVDIICTALNKLLCGTFKDLREYFCIARYEHDDLITQELSMMCDVRIIWGGNRTIEAIRKASIPPRAIELAFADRHSLAIIDSDMYLLQDEKKVAKEFYTDTYYTDQNACSSPRIVIWTGNQIESAKKRFWNELDRLVKDDYQMKPIQAVDKYANFCRLGMKQNGVKLVSKDNDIVRVEVEHLSQNLMEYKYGGGYFFEYSADKLDEIVPILDKQCQTISYLGVERQKIKDLVFTHGVRGVDRIVPMGQTMGLEFIWDGYKMIETMSRFVYTGEYY